MDPKLSDSEMAVMEVLWTDGPCTAKHLTDVLREKRGWNMNTVYTLIRRCIDKGAIERTDPHYMCHALFLKEEAEQQETDRVLDRFFDGSVDKLFASLLGRRRLSREQIDRLREMVDAIEEDEK